MSQIIATNLEPIPYATPASNPPSRVAPAVWLAIIGLVLICLGGCFLIGVMMTLGVNSLGTATPMSGRIVFFLIVLYASAFGCFGGAVILVVQGVRSLFKLL